MICGTRNLLFLVTNIMVNMVNGNVFTHVAPENSQELVYACTCVPDRIEIWKCWFLTTGENRSTPRKTSRSKDRTNNKVNPRMVPGPGIETGPLWGAWSSLTLSRPAFFPSFWTGGGGGGGAVAPISNSENINATTMKLGGCIVCLKLFPLRSASWVDDATTMKLGGCIVCLKLFPLRSASCVEDVTWRGNYVMISKRWPYWSAILDF